MLEKLIDILSPQPLGEDRFLGQNMHPEAFRVYGGQVLAQCVSSAIATVPQDRHIHSQHAYFLRPGDPAEPIVYEVEKARDGGSFSSRRVVALQRGKAILVSSMSFQVPSPGDEYQPEMLDVPPPESLRSERQLGIEAGTVNESFMITTGEDLDVRVIDPIDWENPVVRDPAIQVWMKTNGALPDQPGLQHAMLAYLSDAFLIDVCLLPCGRSFLEEGLQVASLDHALWFHSDFRCDEWLLHTVDAERVAGSRGLGRGRFFNREGILVASTVQQGLLRAR